MSINTQPANWHSRLQALLPKSLLGRLSLVMVCGVLLTQLVGSAIWSTQQRAKAEIETRIAAEHLARSAATAIRFFHSLPPNYRSVLIQQFREMGGTRFFVQSNPAYVTLPEIKDLTLLQSAARAVQQTLKTELPQAGEIRLAFAWPDELSISPAAAKLNELPDSWVQHILLLKPDPAPILVIQAELEPGNWLYLASLMPNPYFYKSEDLLSSDRLLLQGLSLAAVLLLSILVVRGITRPLAALSEAAEAFGHGENHSILPPTGSSEFVKTAQAFSAMQARIQGYLKDRERLFISISHDLRTPITRLKLRSELLDDEALRSDFEEDLDELDMMVKGALQCVKDSDIHENPTLIKLDNMIGKLVRSAHLAKHQVSYSESGMQVVAKPLALKRAIANVLDNAIFYGDGAQIACTQCLQFVSIQIRDFGPGVDPEAMSSVFDPYLRLSHGRDKNAQGLGLGLAITRDIIAAHHGKLQLQNHPEGGLIVTLSLPLISSQPEFS